MPSSDKVLGLDVPYPTTFVIIIIQIIDFYGPGTPEGKILIIDTVSQNEPRSP